MVAAEQCSSPLGVVAGLQLPRTPGDIAPPCAPARSPLLDGVVAPASCTGAARIDVPWLVPGGSSGHSREVASLLGDRSYCIETLPVDDERALESLLLARHPRLMLVDVEVCDLAGTAAMRRLHRHYPATAWVLAWSAPSHTWLPALISSAARGAILRHDDAPKLARALDAVLDGDLWLPRVAMHWMYDALLDQTGLDGDGAAPCRGQGIDMELTPRESQAIDLMRQGLTNRAIADRLGISINTVKKHLANAFEKLGIRARRQLCG